MKERKKEGKKEGKKETFIQVSMYLTILTTTILIFNKFLLFQLISSLLG